MPSLEIEMFKTLFSYHYALFDKLWESIMTLTDEQFVQPVDYSHGSIRHQMVHATITEIRWVRGLKDDPASRQFILDPADYRTRARTRRLWDDARMEIEAFVANLDEKELSRFPQGMPGPVWQVLLHLANHGTDHRAQILRALHDLGAPTFDQDLIIHLWQQR